MTYKFRRFIGLLLSTERAYTWIPLLIAILVALSYRFDWFKAVDNLIYDTVLSLSEREHNEDLVIVNIDQASLDAIGRWPWNRQHHAELLKNLSSADAVVFDILFPEKNKDYPAGDTSFAQAIEKHGSIILPVHLESVRERGQILEVPPISIFYEAANRIGHVHVHCESDSICRSFFAFEGVGSPYWSHIVIELYDLLNKNTNDVQNNKVEKQISPKSLTTIYNTYLDDSLRSSVSDDSPYNIHRKHQLFIPFDRAPRRFSTVSYVDVFSGEIPSSAFEGKVVFVGATSAGLGDYLSTPVGLLPGVEIHVLAYEALLNGNFITKYQGLVSTLFFFLITFLLSTLMSRLSPSQFLASLLCLIGLTLYIEFLLIRFCSIWFPTASFIIGMLVFYPLWNWLKLRLALIFLSDTLKRVNHYEQEAKLEYLSYSPKSNVLTSDIYFVGQENPSKHQNVQVEVVTQTIQQMERALTLAEVNQNLIQKSLSNLQDAVIILNHHGDVVLANEVAEQLFFNDDTSTLLDVYQMFVNKSEQKITRSVEKLLDVGLEFSEELELNLEKISIKKQKKRPQEAFTKHTHFLLGLGKTIQLPLNRFNDDLVDICLLTFVDISKIKEVERSRLDTLNFLSHDLRAPMVSVLALIEQFEMQNEKLSSKSFSNLTDQLLTRVKSYVQKNLHYSESILQLSRAEELSEQAFNLVDMHAIIDSVYMQAKPVAEIAGISLNVDKENCDAWVMGHAELLERVFTNIINNAIKFSTPNTVIDLKMNVSTERVKVSIRDQGEGIPSSALNQIFDRYVKNNAQPNKKGAGLGLFFVKSVIEKHKGQIEVESELGKGTIFTVSLPSCEFDLA